jgi:hypothetical protein
VHRLCVGDEGIGGYSFPLHLLLDWLRLREEERQIKVYLGCKEKRHIPRHNPRTPNEKPNTKQPYKHIPTIDNQSDRVGRVV